VLPGSRRLGIAQALLGEVERVAREGGARRIILQAGDQQPEAVALYRKLGWSPIPVYEPYIETMPNSLCFEKPLSR
jgi:GNAT superfamily N-acetyltransferase